MLGLLVASVAWFGTRFPMLQIWTPASEVELLGVEVRRSRSGADPRAMNPRQLLAEHVVIVLIETQDRVNWPGRSGP
jgi:hypothetical protein